MEIKTLAHVSLDLIVSCFLEAFSDYIFQMPTAVDYYRKRWHLAKVDYSLSYGAFVDDQLVGFIIHGIDNRGGHLTAFNTGTGVIPAYRGQRIVKKIYAFALSDLRSKGVSRSILEVITSNDKAIRAYEGVGFQKVKTFHCYNGPFEVDTRIEFDCRLVEKTALQDSLLSLDHTYSWDFQWNTIQAADYAYYTVFNPEGRRVGYFVFDESKSTLVRFEVDRANQAECLVLFAAIKSLTTKLKINNVDAALYYKVEAIEAIHLPKVIDQYEMILDLD